MKWMRYMFLAAVIAAGIVCVGMPRAASADVNDFSLPSFTADYYPQRQANNRSAMEVTEQIVATFPAINQNHGIERRIPNVYDGHTVRVRVRSVTDANGKDWQYAVSGVGDYTNVRIGDADRYVHGEQTYHIRYSLQDVTRNFDNYDELFWDVNGDQWQQSFGTVEARLHLKGSLADAYTKQAKCFQGIAGSGDACAVATEQKDDETVLTFAATRALGPGENVSFVTGFQKGTFAPYEKTAWERLWPLLLASWFIIGGVILVIVIIMLVRLWRRYGKAPAGKGTIVPEYIPPKDTSVLIAAHVVRKSATAATAQLIDLAVRHYVRLYEKEVKSGFFGKRRSYDIELIRDASLLRSEELQVLRAFFGGTPRVGSRVSMDKHKTSMYTKMAALEKTITKQAETEGLFEDRAALRKKYYWIGGILLVLGVVTLNPGVFLAGLLTLIVAGQLRPLTAQGVVLRDYLEGLKLYMQLADADRLRLLQSPEGAAKVPSGITNDTAQLVKLYERLLPYAIVFGIEKQWLEAFAPLYDQAPDWYGGNWNTFNAGVFATSLHSFAATSTASYAPPSSSSSSGFSGGSSGGGGGGGGGGGW